MWSRNQTLLPPLVHQLPLLSIFNLSLLASVHPPLNVSLSHLILTLYWPWATIYLPFLCHKLFERSALTSHSPFVPFNFASSLPLRVNCSLHGKHQHACSQIKWIFLSLPFITSHSSDINGNSLPSFKIFFISFSFSLPGYHYFLGFSSSFSHSFPISFTGSFSILPLYLMSFSSHLMHFWCLHLIPRCNYKPNAVNFQTSIFTQMSLEPSTFMSNCLRDV